MNDRLRVVIATPLEDELCALLAELEPRLDIIVDQELLPPMRGPGDHGGDPSFTRTPEQQARYEELVDSAEALYGLPDSSSAALARTVRANPHLKWVHTMAAGGGAQVKAAQLTDEELARVQWSTSAGPHAATLAEFAVFGVLAGAKNLPRLTADQRAKNWPERWMMKHVFHMQVTVVGLGTIGRASAERLHALGARVIGVNRSPVDSDMYAEMYGPERLAEAVAGSDAVVLALPGTDATFHLVNEAVFDAMDEGTILVNVGRGTVVEEGALIAALESGKVGFAALDVVEVEPLPESSPLWEHPNVLISPHTAALDADEDRLIAEMFAENATRLLDGVPLINEMDRVHFY